MKIAFSKGNLEVTTEIISWKSSDGLEIEGVLSTPVELDNNKKYPLLVVIHGFGLGIFSDIFRLLQ